MVSWYPKEGTVGREPDFAFEAPYFYHSCCLDFSNLLSFFILLVSHSLSIYVNDIGDNASCLNLERVELDTLGTTSTLGNRSSELSLSVHALARIIVLQ